jgi:hypothetical protein
VIALQLMRFSVQENRKAAECASAAANEREESRKLEQQKKETAKRKATAKSNATAHQQALQKELDDLNADTAVRTAAEAAVAAKDTFVHIRSFGVCVLTAIC